MSRLRRVEPVNITSASHDAESNPAAKSDYSVVQGLQICPGLGLIFRGLARLHREDPRKSLFLEPMTTAQRSIITQHSKASLGYSSKTTTSSLEKANARQAFLRTQYPGRQILPTYVDRGKDSGPLIEEACK